MPSNNGGVYDFMAGAVNGAVVLMLFSMTTLHQLPEFLIRLQTSGS